MTGSSESKITNREWNFWRERSRGGRFFPSWRPVCLEGERKGEGANGGWEEDFRDDRSERT